MRRRKMAVRGRRAARVCYVSIVWKPAIVHIHSTHPIPCEKHSLTKFVSTIRFPFRRWIGKWLSLNLTINFPWQIFRQFRVWCYVLLITSSPIMVPTFGFRIRFPDQEFIFGNLKVRRKRNSELGNYHSIYFSELKKLITTYVCACLNILFERKNTLVSETAFLISNPNLETVRVRPA